MVNAVDLNNATSVSWNLGTTGQTVVLTVTKPDGATVTPSVTEASGVYSATVATPLAGRYILSWSVAATSKKYSDVLNVFPADPRFIVSLVEAKSMLTIPSTMTHDEDNLRIVLAAVTVVLEDLNGDILIHERTQTSDGGRPSINLYHRPTDVVSVHEDDIALVENTGFVIDYQAAILHAGSKKSSRYFAGGRQNVTIVYSTGAAATDANIRLAATLLLKHLWGIFQSGHNEYTVAPDEMTESPSGYLVPSVVASLVRAGHNRLPGFA